MSTVVVAAPSRLAADIGGQVAEMGGSVIDAVIASTVTAMCTEPGVCAPGGGGYLTVWPADADPVTVDGYMAMPGLGRRPEQAPVTRTVSMDYGGGITTEVGPGSIAVPGGFAALSAAHDRWGRAPWREVIRHVAATLDGGFPLPTSCHHYLGFSGGPVFGVDPASRAALHDGDRLRDAGELIHVEGMTDSLRAIADDGAVTFYRGDLANAIMTDLIDRGGRVTRTDLADYRAEIRAPLRSTIGRWTVATNPPPAVGGVAVTAILRLVAASSSPLDPAEWVAAQRMVFSYRKDVLDVAPDRERAGWEFLQALPDDPVRAGSTVNISAAGSDGSVATATMSAGYGSGVIPRGTGLWMNNSLGEHELNPRNSSVVGPGERMVSNMAPTVAGTSGRRVAIGSPGADRITSALATTLTLMIHDEASLASAIEHPRAHYERDRGTVAVERGLEVGGGGPDVRRYSGLDMYFGGVTAAEVSGRRLVGHADTRRTGGVAVAGPET